MKKILFLCVLMFLFAFAKAQRVYFIYLQSENGSPFFIKMSDKVYSSTASGYLIVPKLKDSTYLFSVGRVGRQNAEPKFSVTISNNDKGYLIRDNEGRVSLFNLQTLAVEAPVVSETSNVGNTEQRTDAFTRLLAKAADDSTLLTVAFVTKEEKKKKPAKPVMEKKEITTAIEPEKTPEKETVAIIKEEAVQKPAQQNTTVTNDTSASPANSITQTKIIEQPPVKQEDTKAITETPVKKIAEEKNEIVQAKTETTPKTTEVVKEKDYKKSIVTRRSESSTSEGFGLVFLDKSETSIDTIRILIPNPKSGVRLVVANPEKTKPEVIEEKPVTTTANIPKKEKLSCIYLASENEFKRLRRIMAAKNNDEGMLTEAKRGFKNTCFTTEQIRNLSALFLTASGKYSFFDAAFGHAIDSEAFVTLGSEIKDDYYSRRFKALIGN